MGAGVDPLTNDVLVAPFGGANKVFAIHGFASPDVDKDGVVDLQDNCPTVANTDQKNSDSDTLGDACDPDDDNDGFADTVDAFPLDPLEHVDTDGDGVGDYSDACPLDAPNDGDGDGICSSADVCPTVYDPSQADFDGDHLGDLCDPTGTATACSTASTCASGSTTGSTPTRTASPTGRTATATRATSAWTRTTTRTRTGCAPTRTTAR
jgi:hypothetical protein